MVKTINTDKIVIFCVFVLGSFFLLAIFGPFCVIQHPGHVDAFNLRDALLPPGSLSSEGSFRYLLGTDDQGRDILSAITYGLRTSLFVAFISSTFAILLGSFLGIASAWYGGWVDQIIGRIIDLKLSIPSILVALVLITFIASGVPSLILALTLVQWAYYARLVRSRILSLLQLNFVKALKGLGLPTYRILLWHLFPNSLVVVKDVIAIQLVHAVLMESSLSFLGLGASISQPSLGLLIHNGLEWVISGKYWIVFPPCLVLFLLVFSLNMLSDRLSQFRGDIL